MRDDCDKYGVTFEAIRMDAKYITMRKGAERDRELDNILGNIQKASDGRGENHHLSLDRDPDSAKPSDPGRGDVTYASFKLEDNWKDLPVEQIRQGSFGRLLGANYYTFSKR